MKGPVGARSLLRLLNWPILIELDILKHALTVELICCLRIDVSVYKHVWLLLRLELLCWVSEIFWPNTRMARLRQFIADHLVFSSIKWIWSLNLSHFLLIRVILTDILFDFQQWCLQPPLLATVKNWSVEINYYLACLIDAWFFYHPNNTIGTSHVLESLILSLLIDSFGETWGGFLRIFIHQVVPWAIL